MGLSNRLRGGKSAVRGGSRDGAGLPAKRVCNPWAATLEAFRLTP